jgi:hypothetical protein
MTGYMQGRTRELFTLAWEDAVSGHVTHTNATRATIERMGSILMRRASRGTVWNIAVYDEGGDCTFDFPCFSV